MASCRYYINHFNKTTTWEDPRVRLNRALPHGTSKHFSNMQVEHIPLQVNLNINVYLYFGDCRIDTHIVSLHAALLDY